MKQDFFLLILVFISLKMVNANDKTVKNVNSTQSDNFKNGTTIAITSSRSTKISSRASTTSTKTSSRASTTSTKKYATNSISNSNFLTNNTNPTKTTTKTSTIVTTVIKPSVNDALNLNPANCGKRPLKQIKIVGGNQTIVGDWGWQVALFYDGRFACGGSILNSEWVITAGHCVIAREMDLFRIDIGLNNRLNPEKWSKRRNLSRLIVHDFYDSNTLFNDIALLKLSKPIDYTSSIIPVCVPQQSQNFVGKISWATGWGTTSRGGSESNVLLEVSMPWLNDSRCLQKYPDVNTTISICAGEIGENKDTCQGDSGGPLVVQDSDGRWYLGGLTSWGYGCADGGVYTRTSYYYNWILETIREKPFDVLDDFPNVKISTLLPYGIKNGDTALPIFDDESFGPFKLNKKLNISTKLISELYINSNGFISSKRYNLFSFPDMGYFEILAIGALFYDFKNYGSSSLFYRQTTNLSLLNQIETQIVAAYNSKYSNLKLNWALIITWKDVSAFSSKSDKSTFQLVLANGDSCQIFVLFQYEKLNLPDKLKLKAGYTLGDFINYKSLNNAINEFIANPSYFPRSVIYQLNLSPICP